MDLESAFTRSVLIRTATAEDGDAIAAVLNALLSTTAIEWTETSHTPQSILAWLAEHVCVLVAEDDDEVIGVAALWLVP